MKKKFVVLYCENCERYYRRSDPVVLDIFNSVYHESCYKKLTEYKIIDRGTYGEIVDKYDFFKEFR